jgi:hypothetical protein
MMSAGMLARSESRCWLAFRATNPCAVTKKAAVKSMAALPEVSDEAAIGQRVGDQSATIGK